MNKKDLKQKVTELTKEGEWNHYYELPYGIVTRQTHIDSPGYCINKWNRLRPILESVRVKDKTVIDIGCSDGYFCIETVKLGAKYVYGTDVDELRIKKEEIKIQVNTFNLGPCVTRFKIQDDFRKVLLDEAKKTEQDFSDRLAGQIAKERGYSEKQREIIIPYLSPYLGIYDEAFQRYQNKRNEHVIP